MMKIYGVFLIAELVVVAVVPLVFTSVSNRLLAGAIAGTIFISLGLAILWRGVRDRNFRRSPTFYAGCLHLFGSALPLFVTRLMNYSKGFEDVRVLGLSGPMFHRVSTGIFSVLLLATIYDLVRTWWIGRSVHKQS